IAHTRRGYGEVCRQWLIGIRLLPRILNISLQRLRAARCAEIDPSVTAVSFAAGVVDTAVVRQHEVAETVAIRVTYSERKIEATVIGSRRIGYAVLRGLRKPSVRSVCRDNCRVPLVHPSWSWRVRALVGPNSNHIPPTVAVPVSDADAAEDLPRLAIATRLTYIQPVAVCGAKVRAWKRVRRAGRKPGVQHWAV